ncbi:MAG: peptide-methionine (S)-S-oxide reductase MsrA [Candidatus Chisholmbacteria bacterium]|nr:peptide-methionine (S)-S-oxide reductase MsrA [Candidatus Chisholmbacteria bacterium]
MTLNRAATESTRLRQATFAGGCFWCTEAVFKMLKGVTKVTPGYTGGTMENPHYYTVSMGTTGHAEAIQIEFDPSKIAYPDLLHVFFATHDPTTLNQQGADSGTQYRSAIFYHDEEQKKQAEKAIKLAQKDHPSKVVTEITRFTTFYVAENYHHDYYRKNSSAPYCRIVIDPKIQKLKTKFSPYLKHSNPDH